MNVYDASRLKSGVFGSLDIIEHMIAPQANRLLHQLEIRRLSCSIDLNLMKESANEERNCLHLFLSLSWVCLSFTQNFTSCFTGHFLRNFDHMDWCIRVDWPSWQYGLNSLHFYFIPIVSENKYRHWFTTFTCISNQPHLLHLLAFHDIFSFSIPWKIDTI